MQDLTPVGLSEDGARLVLISAAGEEFAVPVDARLRAALRGENARLGQLEMKMDSALRPRDIQARIRAGESPEEVAAAAQTSVDGIMAFARPVLAERAHVALTAQRASVRRRTGESSPAGRSLGEAAELFFTAHSLHDEDVEWDSWRRPDGRWALVATYAVEGRPLRAEFTHDMPGRYVVAENDEARVLIGEMRDSTAPAPTARAAAARRLSSVPSEDELPLGDDAIEMVRDRANGEPGDQAGDQLDAQPASAPEDVTTASQQPAPAAATERRDSRRTVSTEDTETLPFLDPTADTADADWLVDGAAPVEEPTSGAADEVAPAETGATEGSDGQPAAPAASEEEAAAKPEAPAPKRKGRSSVPSWDEIMFGGGGND